MIIIFWDQFIRTYLITNDFVVMCVGFFIKVFYIKRDFLENLLDLFFNYAKPEYSKKGRQRETKMTSTTYFAADI